MNERAHHGCALSHAARQLLRIAIFKTLETHEGEQVYCALSKRVTAQMLHVDREQDVLEYRTPGKQDRRLKGNTNVPARPGDRCTTELCLTL